ncbi:MAG: regulatory signaling modulator protein AmpE [Alcanivorax sediminis]|uniref:regulatory signaling modulator protein AmpE n=1 Tax=Alcanivorax sediminis TaxID=2663008 RepID=UPI003C6058F8
MTFLMLILVLGLRRLESDWPHWMINGQRHHAWLQILASRFGNGLLLWCLAIAIPAVLLGLIECWLQGFWGQWLWLLLGSVVLLWLLGGHSEFRQVDELLVRGRMNDPEGFAALAEDEFGVQGDPMEPAVQQALAERILGREQQLFVAIFWLVVFGLPAALVVVLNHAWSQRAERENTRWATTLDHWLSWPAQRLMIFSMALVGDFAAVLDYMRGHWLKLQGAEKHAAIAARVAMDVPEQEVGSPFYQMIAPLESLQGLLLRCMAVWLIMAALWVMLS